MTPCGSILYSLTSSPTLSIADGSITLNSLNNELSAISTSALAGTYAITITGTVPGNTLNGYVTFNLNIGSFTGCLIARVFSDPITSPQSYLIGAVPLTVTFNNWEETTNPTCCTMQYTATYSSSGTLYNFS